MNKNLYLFFALLTIAFNGCKKDKKNIPVADFIYSGTNVPAPATISFNNTSTDATDFVWDFGDNESSIEKNPQHTYIYGGVYTVRLTAKGEGGTNTISRTINIQNTPGPLASFTFTGGGCIAPCSVIFNNSSLNATSYSWDFGDGQTSTLQNPTHTFNSGGIFSIQLTASSTVGSNSIAKTLSVQASGGTTADFTFTGGAGQAPCVVTFTDASINATSWYWDFGDGQTSTQQNPNHTYTTGGSFNVQLTVTGPTGNNSITKSVGILAPPTDCKITNVSILNCPLTDAGGNGWDAPGAPDFYFNIETTTGAIYYTSNYYTDVSTFPQTWILNPTYNFNNLSWNTNHKIHIWEHDNPDPDDNVSSCTLLLNNYATVTNHYPTQITLTNGITQVQLTVQWQ